MNATQSSLWNELRQLTEKVSKIADDITVVFVANRQKGLTGESQDRSTEYFTDIETNQLLTGFRQSGFRTLYFEGEMEFITYVISSHGKIANSRFAIVYNTAQSGTDPGRKSMIPSFCALHNICTCNSNSYAVSLARHKLHVHAILHKYSIPTPNTWAFDCETSWLRDETPQKDVKLIAKAGHESASIGLDNSSLGMISSEFEDILRRKTGELQQQFVVQRFINGREFEVPVVIYNKSCAAITPVEIKLDGHSLEDAILSYETIAYDSFEFYITNGAPSLLDQNMRVYAEAVCEVLGLNGFARVDFRVDKDNNPWVTDVSTSPHIVKHSSYWHAFMHAGWEHSEMLACMIAINAKNLGWIE